MPTSTSPFEVLFEFTNDTVNTATIRLTSGGAMILLHTGESVSLVLSAGSTYHYILQQQTRKAQISVRTWQDIQCNATRVFARHCEQGYVPWTPTQGVVVTCIEAD